MNPIRWKEGNFEIEQPTDSHYVCIRSKGDIDKLYQRIAKVYLSLEENTFTLKGTDQVYRAKIIRRWQYDTTFTDEVKRVTVSHTNKIKAIWVYVRVK